MKKHELDILMRTPLFKEIERQEVEHMLGCFLPKVNPYKKGEVITIEDTPYDGIGIVLSGIATISKTNEVGERVIISQVQEGGVFGEMIAFAKKKRWPATVIAESDVEVMFIKPEAITHHCSRMCVGHRQLMVNMLEILSMKALNLNRKVQYLSIKSMRGKICKFLSEEWSKNEKDFFDIPYNRNELAEFLNVSRPSMSRELKKMKEEGLIDFYQSSFRIINREELFELASHLH